MIKQEGDEMKKLLILLLFFALPLSAQAHDEHYKPKKGAEKLYIVNDILIASKSKPLPKDYAPLKKEGRGTELYKPAQTAFLKMQKDAKKEGINLFILSGYRSYQTQKNLFASYANAHGKEKANQFSAHAGESEHQTGLAIDIGDTSYPELTLEEAFGKTKAGIWLAKYAHRYGFILRYPKGEEKVTGYQYEPWHFRYVGKEVANAMKKENIKTLEAYLGLNESLGRMVAIPKKVHLISGENKMETTTYLLKNKTYLHLSDLIYLASEMKSKVHLLSQNNGTIVLSTEEMPFGENPLLKKTTKIGLRTAIPYRDKVSFNGWYLNYGIYKINNEPHVELTYYANLFGYKLNIAKEGKIPVFSLDWKELSPYQTIMKNTPIPSVIQTDKSIKNQDFIPYPKEPGSEK